MPTPRNASNTTYVAFLRAINVGGHAIVKMQALKKRFASAGCRNVRTYIQSGNVVFDAAPAEATALFQRVREGLGALLGAEPEIAFRRLRDVARIVEADPFTAYDGDRTLKLYVAFLAAKPRVKPALPLVSSKERLEVIGVKNLEAYIVSRRKPNGFYGFPNNFVEAALGVPATTRNWSTVTKIVALVHGGAAD
jgi:uncharacterized protein (DUF1697 family)